MSKRSIRVLEELSSVTEAKLLLQAAVDRQAIRRLQSEVEEVEDSQMDGITKAKIKRLSDKKKGLLADDNQNIQKISKKFKTIDDSSKLSVVLNSCENYKPSTIFEKVVIRIYLFVLRIHSEKPWSFSSESLNRYSEFDLQVKFWGYVFETYLGRNRHVILNWGDTMSDTCKRVGLRFKLDLRLLVLKEDETVADGVIGEVAKKATKAKFYTDRLKSVVTTKCHLNAFLESLPYISEEEIADVKFPIVQIMGLEAKVSSLRLVEKKVYLMEDLYSFNFPQTLHQIRTGKLEYLVNGLTLIEKMVNDLERKYNDGQNEGGSSMNRIMNETRRKKKVMMSQWLSEIIWDEEDEEAEEAENRGNEDSSGMHKGNNDITSDEDSDDTTNDYVFLSVNGNVTSFDVGKIENDERNEEAEMHNTCCS
ncbi:hypothetical protein DFQ30_002101, partial [Apophysomyces sp. BC1015]